MCICPCEYFFFYIRWITIDLLSFYLICILGNLLIYDIYCSLRWARQRREKWARRPPPPPPHPTIKKTNISVILQDGVPVVIFTLVIDNVKTITIKSFSLQSNHPRQRVKQIKTPRCIKISKANYSNRLVGDWSACWCEALEGRLHFW